MSTKIILLISIILFIMINIYMPILRIKRLKKCGKYLYAFGKKEFGKNISILVLSLVLLLLIYCMDYSFFINCILSSCAIIATYIGLKELYFAPIQGIYEKALLFRGTFILYSNITNYVEDDISSVQNRIVFTLKKGSCAIVFETEEQKNIVIDYLTRKGFFDKL